jgi:hypothetical protein
MALPDRPEWPSSKHIVNVSPVQLPGLPEFPAEVIDEKPGSRHGNGRAVKMWTDLHTLPAILSAETQIGSGSLGDTTADHCTK